MGARRDVHLSGLVIAQDEEDRIRACLEALAFCDEQVVVDGGSADGTCELARSLGARVVERRFTSMNDQKEFGRGVCNGQWILNVDADEVVSAELARQVRSVVDDSNSRYAAYRVTFRNYFRGEWVKTCGYHPDRHVRLVRKAEARWDATVPTHDRIVVAGRIGTLSGWVDHYSFRSLDHFLDKSRRYATEIAAARHAEGRRVSGLAIFGRAAFRFFRAYVLQRGFMQGRLGLVIAGLQAQEVFQKYARQWELEHFGSDR